MIPESVPGLFVGFLCPPVAGEVSGVSLLEAELSCGAGRGFWQDRVTRERFLCFPRSLALPSDPMSPSGSAWEWGETRSALSCAFNSVPSQEFVIYSQAVANSHCTQGAIK